jgi:ABC-type uncharacterized transport system substrate-binding protein
MKRRAFISLPGGAAAWPVVARAQQPAMPVIGFLIGQSLEQWADQVAAVRKGLSENSYAEGRNLTIEFRFAQNQPDRLPGLAADLVRRQVQAIVTSGGDVAARAAMAATSTIPIVASFGGDPVENGFVASLNRPGGNVTGVSLFNVELVGKQFEVFFRALPSVRLALASRHHIPTMYYQRGFPEVGGLMSYGSNRWEDYRQLGAYAGKILGGIKPADLPVIQPSKLELVINLKTAKALGLDLPPNLLALADEVIE